jgi:phosphate:Na+ symporter
LSAYYAGAIGLDQACALIIGQNIGTATSSAMAAIGASTTAKRLAVAYILFKLIAAVIALALFPIVIPLLVRASSSIDGLTLLAAYHTAYNVIGVAVLLPVMARFTRFVERTLPDRGHTLTRYLDPSTLSVPIAAEEAVRKTVAAALGTMCTSLSAALADKGGDRRPAPSMDEPTKALLQAQEFMSEVSRPPDSPEEQRRLTLTMHALNHASRLAEVASGENLFWIIHQGDENARAATLCADALTEAAGILSQITAQPGTENTTPLTQERLSHLERAARELDALQTSHRAASLAAIGSGAMTANEAMASVDMVRRLEAIAHHAWRSTTQLVEAGA